MITLSRKVESIIKELHQRENRGKIIPSELNEIMKSNENRLRYLIHLFEKVEEEKLTKSCRDALKRNIDFLIDFMNGSYEYELTVPSKYYYDKEKNLIVQTNEDYEYLMRLLEANVEIFDLLYRDKRFMFHLPENTLNQKMVRVLEIKYYNIAHLVGLTETELTPDPNKNQLKKYFLTNVKNQEQYGEKLSERLLNWLLSEEGKTEIRKLIEITNRFIEMDRIKNPNNYDSNGNIKEKSLQKFKERFKNETGFDYPIIKFSRCITKCINNLNFLQMNNINQMILDYNAPEGKNDEKDIFLVSCPSERMETSINAYISLKEYIYDLLNKYAFAKTEEERNEYSRLLEIKGINVKEKEIDSYINLMKTRHLFEDKGITPDLSSIEDIIRGIIDKAQFRDMHLIGFGTEFKNGNVSVDKRTVNWSHCDTSISLTAAELVGEFYQRGRPFFLDKVLEGNGQRVLRISNPTEELRFLRQQELTGVKTESDQAKIERLLEIFKNEAYKFKRKYVDSLKK